MPSTALVGECETSGSSRHRDVALMKHVADSPKAKHVMLCLSDLVLRPRDMRS
ncbi:hypothetical protein GGQ73_002360 [Rhizobium skierniewicense]|uniref:Uncharacterized protein n=1 Tax=Rhizobium skierniewicense TaxID=984260 RepID=A0A7W6C615_9HYPH|nr:hypothetical protein [Rhizobium skierniewicense]